MSERGRSYGESKQPTIVFNESSSSSTQHTADRIGMSVEEFPSELEPSGSSTRQFGFLYSKESDKIGAMVSKQGMNLRSEAPTAAACARRRALKIAQLTADANPKLVQPMPDHNLSCYQHDAKAENPRYATTSNEYGKQAPTIATTVSERFIRSQAFSKSFNNTNSRNTSLTTCMTKSNVHSNLDPHFT